MTIEVTGMLHTGYRIGTDGEQVDTIFEFYRKVFQLDMADRTIRPLRIDPQENKVNEVRTGDVPVDYRFHIEPDSHRLLGGFPRLER